MRTLSDAEYDNKIKNFANYVKGKIDMNRVKDRTDLLIELESLRDRHIPPSDRQIEVLGDHFDLQERIPFTIERKIVEEKIDTVTITPRGFKKRQIRDRKTGKIVGWL